MNMLLLIIGIFILVFWLFINALAFSKIRSMYASSKDTYFFECWDRFWKDCQKCFSSPEGLPVLLLFLVIIALFSKCKFKLLSTRKDLGTR